MNVLRVLRDMAWGRMTWVPDVERQQATAMPDRGVECLVASQVVVAGKRTVWGQQHDPLTLAPVAAPSYEPPSLSGRESAGIAELLMTLRTPDQSIVAKGARRGWLEPRDRAVAQRGFDGLVRHLLTVGADGLVSLNGICQVAGLGGKQQRDGSFRYYIGEPVVANDHKGVGAFLLAAAELDR